MRVLQLIAVGLALFVLTTLLLGNNAYLIFLLGCMNLVVFLTGAWLTLQFRWLQRDSPALSVVSVFPLPPVAGIAHDGKRFDMCLAALKVLERLVLGGLPIPTAVILTWATVSAYGFDYAPFALAAYSYVGFALLGVVRHP